MTGPINHMGLACADPLAVERWYTEHFGFERKRVYAPGPGQVVVRVEEQELDPLRVLREEREVDAVGVDGRAERLRPPRLDHGQDVSDRAAAGCSRRCNPG